MRLIDDAMRELHRAAGAKLAYAVALACCAAAAVYLADGSRDRISVPAAEEWPQTWDGAPIRPLASSEVERRFAARFPGTVIRLTDGQRQFVMRRVDEPTRMLHPAADCYRGTGYRIDAIRVERDSRSRDWRCFDAERDGQRLRVCERIVDRDGQAFTDTSAWFWASMSGRSVGPWTAVTVAQVAP